MTHIFPIDPPLYLVSDPVAGVCESERMASKTRKGWLGGRVVTCCTFVDSVPPAKLATTTRVRVSCTLDGAFR